MIPIAIIYEHEGQTVDVFTIKGSFGGVLEVKNAGQVLVLKREGGSTHDLYGPYYVDSTSVIAIREVKPQFKKDDDDGDYSEAENPMWKKSYLVGSIKRETEDKQLVEDTNLISINDHVSGSPYTKYDPKDQNKDSK